MKVWFLIFLFHCIFSFPSLGQQGLSNLWYFGYSNDYPFPYGGSTIDFINGPPEIQLDHRLVNLASTIGMISNSRGDLLFVSNGVIIQNAAKDTMQNSTGLNPSPYTTFNEDRGLNLPQGNIVIPYPGDSLKYYLFHQTLEDWGNSFCSLNLYYSIIDMSLDSGRGAVISKNNVLLHDSLVPGRITACKHANGRDWWIFDHQFNSSMYYKYLVTPDSIMGPFTQSIGVIRNAIAGQCAFSPDGELFANYDPFGDLDIFQFDRCNGDFTLLESISINDSAVSGGVAFSENSRVLYVSSMNYVYQFDLTQSNISSSIQIIAAYDYYYSQIKPYATSFYLAHLAPNGKIYINSGNSTLELHVINYPDSIGSSSYPCQHCIHLPSYNGFTMPNYPNYFLGAKSGTLCDSLPTDINEIYNFEINPYKLTINKRKLNILFFEAGLKCLLYIFDSQGKLLVSQSSVSNRQGLDINLNDNSSGIYFLSIVVNQVAYTSKFILE